MKVEDLRDRLADALAERGERLPYAQANYIIASRGKEHAEELLRDLLLNGEDEEAA